jgi:hypothetical protein
MSWWAGDCDQGCSVKVEFDFDLGHSYDQLQKQIQDHGLKAVEHFKMGLQLLAEATMTLSKAVYVPVVTGNLRSSGFVGPWVKTVDGWLMDIGYGGSAASYAQVVHERPAYMGSHHNQYLKKALDQKTTTAEQELSAWMRRLYQ